MGNLAISASAVLYISGHLQHQFCTWFTCKKVHFDIFLAIQIKSILRGELEGDLEAHTFPKAIYAFLELLRRYIIHTVTHTLAIFQDLETPLSDEIKESLVPPPALGCT